MNGSSSNSPRDQATGTTEFKRIKQTFERHAATLALTFSNGETIETTREHPFYADKCGFVKAKAIRLRLDVRNVLI